MAQENFFLRGPALEISKTSGNGSVGQMFFDLLKNHPKRNEIIMIDEGGANKETFTFDDFFKLSVNLAENLRKMGIKKGDTISIISKNHWKYVLLVISGFYIGAKTFHINPDYSPRELEHLLSKSKPKIAFCSENSHGNVMKIKESKFHDLKIINFDNFDEILKQSSSDQSDFQPVELKSDDTALIMTSSGTTGFPKAVAITHANLTTTFAYIKDDNFVGLTENESMIAYLPFFHVFGLLVAIACLLNGTKFIIIDSFKPDQFLEIIQHHKITKLCAVPPILIFLLQNPLVSRYDLSSIRDILAGAAAISKNTQEKIADKFNIKSMRQMYGMTELSGAVTICPKNLINSGSVGKPVYDAIIKIADPVTGEILKSHEVGEICVKGSTVMKEYCGNVEDTKKAFDEDGFLKSGDLGYFDEEGFLYIVDRLKDIMKYKGFQVSPTELESFLIEYPGVKEVAVVGKPDERAGELPTAFIVKQPNRDLSEEEITKHVAENFSIQKHLHGGVRFVDELPKNPSGKILRRKLREIL